MKHFLTPHGVAMLVACLLIAPASAAEWTVGNRDLSRHLSAHEGKLRTVAIENRRQGAVLRCGKSPEFRLRLSQGTDRTEGDIELTAEDFRVVRSRQTDGSDLEVELENAAHGLRVTVDYAAKPDEWWLRKRLTITSDRRWVLEHVDVEALALPEAWQPYTKDSITSRAPGNWSPNLGQPLYTHGCATFWGLEFPAARNLVVDGSLRCGYLRGLPLEPGQAYRTHAAVVGAGEHPDFLDDAFLAYIDRVRARPFRLQTQYNSWFDFGGGVDHAKFAGSVAKIHAELAARGVKPLKACVIDDGWQDTAADWSDKVWKVNQKFDPDFRGSLATVKQAGSGLGLWLSPGCLFGANPQVAKMRANGFESLQNSMSMAGPKYMRALEDRLVELARQGVCFFKFDGLFGHLNTRDFELNGARCGLPEMPQLGTGGLSSDAAALNGPKFDELKLYYLTAGAERLIRTFDRLGKVQPDVYLVISNGAWLSPWWLMHVDAVWMINAGDAADGSDRTGELVYRDGIYRKIFAAEHTKFPLNSMFNHEPKKTSTGESKEEFRRYLFMNLSRGTGFVECYLKTQALAAHDWDVLAEGLLWCEALWPAFRGARMHGGDPAKGETYGYSGWTKEFGYVSLHNPSGEERLFALKIDRTLGVVPGSGPFTVSAPMPGDADGLPRQASVGDTLTVSLPARGVKLLHFDTRETDWSKLRELQRRAEPPPPDFTGHAILGVWEYVHAGVKHSRTFTPDGICVLASENGIQWQRKFKPDGPNAATAEGGLSHQIQPDGTLLIEGRYRARKR